MFTCLARLDKTVAFSTNKPDKTDNDDRQFGVILQEETARKIF